MDVVVFDARDAHSPAVAVASPGSGLPYRHPRYRGMLRATPEPLLPVAKIRFASPSGHAVAETVATGVWTVVPDADALRAALRSFDPDIQRTRIGVVR